MARSTDPHIASTPKRKRRWRRRLLRVLTAALVVCGLIAVAGVWLVRSLPGIVTAEIGRLTHTRVEAGNFHFQLDGSVFIENLVMRPMHEEPRYDNAILHAASVHARFSRRSLALLSPRLTDLRVTDFLLELQLDLDTAEWNVGAVRFNLPRRRKGGTMPVIRLQEGKLRYCKVSGGDVEVVMSVPVEARCGVELAEQGYGFEIQTSRLSGGHGQSHLTGSWRPGEVVVAGGLSSMDLPSLERAWAVDTLAGQLTYDANDAYRLDLRLKDVHGKQAPEVGGLGLISSAGEIQSGLLASLQGFFARFRPTGTVDSITLTAGGNLRRLRDSKVAGTLVCKDISVCDMRFPYAIDHLAGDIEFTQAGVVVKPLSGRHGDVDVQIEGWTKGFGAERQYRYKASAGNMVLDEDLYAAMAPGRKRMWDAFRPSGTIAAEYWLVRNSPTDRRMYISAELRGVTASFHQFPYPLTDLRGKLYMDQDSIMATNLVSASGDRRICLNAKVTGQGTDKPIHYISIDANNVPLDTTLEKALPVQYRELYACLEADGTADVRAKVFSTGDANTVGPMSYLADVVCHSRSLKLEQLPVTLSDVVGEVAISPNSLQIKRLNGRYGQSHVTLTGEVRPASDGKSKQCRLRARAADVPFNATTIDLLPKTLANQLAAFRPEGDVNVAVEVRMPDGNEPATYVGEVECLGLKINHERFPYPLQDVRGTISLSQDRLTLKNVTAVPVDPCQMTPGAIDGVEGSEPRGSARFRLDGTATLADGGFAGGSFALKAQDLLFTRQLGDALPKGLAGAYRDLSPHGPFDVDVERLMVSRAGPDETLVEFGGRVDLRACDLRLSGTQVGWTGVVKTEGAYSTRQGLSQGRAALAAERLAIKGRTLANVTAEAVYDPNARRWSAGDLLGDCYRGRVLGSLEVGRAEAGGIEYLLQASLSRVDLQQFLLAGKEESRVARNASREGNSSDAARTTQDAQRPEGPYSGGVMSASFSLGGRTGAVASRRGACRVEIENMRVGKVSLLSNLVSVLSLGEPTEYTFERMLIDSYIKQNMLLIPKLDLSGRNAAFTGSGTMTLPGGELNLTLTARGPRPAGVEPSVLESLTEGLGGGVVRIEVTGTAANPLIVTRTLPVFEDSLKILGTPE